MSSGNAGGDDMVVIICEGCDKTGKTTFINEWFKQRDNTIIRHFKQPPEDVDDQEGYQIGRYALEIDWLAVNSHDVNVIYDRFLYGEAVYAPMYRGYSPSWIWDFERRIIGSGIEAVLVLFEATEEEISDKWSGDYLAKHDVRECQDRFREIYDKSRLPKCAVYPALSCGGTCMATSTPRSSRSMRRYGETSQRTAK